MHKSRQTTRARTSIVVALCEDGRRAAISKLLCTNPTIAVWKVVLAKFPMLKFYQVGSKESAGVHTRLSKIRKGTQRNYSWRLRRAKKKKGHSYITRRTRMRFTLSKIIKCCEKTTL